MEVRDVVAGPRSFQREWLADGGKTVVPLPSPSGMDKHLARRMSSGAEQAGYVHVIACHLEGTTAEGPGTEVAATREGLLRDIPWRDGDLLLALPDLTGALLVTDQGFALLAGRAEFLRGSVPEGADQATIDFSRYAKRVGQSRPAVLAVAGEARPPQMAWATKNDVAEGSATAEQLALMEAFVANSISGEEFSVAWLDARRRSMRLQERLRESFSRVLDQVFYALDDYVIDPDLRDTDDMTNDQLRAQVRKHLSDLDSLGRR
ncbi:MULTISPECIES: colicin immunity domain-containing protein [unclassified Streptomyces]|uniref:colicin immunity domain-containing protein n=1 Tax=unclassified Streptomyces TaxID=2593676 RepID=UPI0033F9E87D